MKLDDSITTIKGLGDAAAKKYAVLGISTIQDLLLHLPRRYDDFSAVANIQSLTPGPVTIQAKITNTKGRYVRRGMHITEAVAEDAGSKVRIVWFNQPYREASLKHDQEYFISGNYELSSGRLAIMNPSIELVSDLPVQTARIMPIYKETKGLTSKQIRKHVAVLRGLIQNTPETLPPSIVKTNGLLGYGDALRTLHFPENMHELKQARYRLGFEEIFELSLAGLLNKQAFQKQSSVTIGFDETVVKQFTTSLPFTLTDEQKKVAWRIYQAMEASMPMNMLVEGDVGSGKTVVAAMAAVLVIHHGFQVALMAPTEILAQQHAASLYSLLEPIGKAGQVGLLTGSMNKKQKEAAKEALRTGSTMLIIGTHALIEEHIELQNLGLVIIDEQHRFGVEQRKKLQKKANTMPHVLHLTATPIPRSLALTLYGELDIALIRHKPAGRQEVITEICSPNSRASLYTKIEQELLTGRQMFVVCPLIEESDNLPARSAEETFKDIQKNFKHRTIGLLHGKLKAQEKNAIMQSFQKHEIDILVSTTVIEVGVDVPNASIMLLESAERFGLSQIHQLRGRVGRGDHKGYCYLMLSDSKPASKRLRAIESTNDGFRLAELDLELRGPGALYGLAQHGALDLRVASLTDVALIEAARMAAGNFLESGKNLLQYTQLSRRVNLLRTVTNTN